ncbi:unnamed protein product [Dicrocoelium dendriticum]|nr:unnamed protein product [Dicrocoelium dendriticum]CAH8459541.1 unnamed protein product [Dicrocoelium dendriticum]
MLKVIFQLQELTQRVVSSTTECICLEVVTAYIIPVGIIPWGRIDWLDDLHCFDPSTLHWSRLTLRHATHDVAQNPPVRAGQSGCFLPSGPEGQCCLLVLFGGFSHSSGTCTNDVCIIAPDKEQWFSLSAPADADSGCGWPVGRCGHSVCALDADRMLVMYGNLESPVAPSFEPPVRRQRLPHLQPNLEDDSQQYRGQPAADMWILTRSCSSPNQDWCSTHWYWTSVVCPINVTGCPSIDFYHASVVTLPYCDSNKSYEPDPEYSTESAQSCQSLGATYTVLCISQPTPSLLEEAMRQRRTWPRRKTMSSISGRRNSLSPSTSVSSEHLTQPNGEAPSEPGSPSNELNDLATFSAPQSPASAPETEDRCSPTGLHPIEDDQLTPGTLISRLPSPITSSAVATRRSEDRRAKQLKALAAQERRLFGPRKQLPNASTDSASGGTSSSATETATGIRHLEWSMPTRPMAIYSLQIHIPHSPSDGGALITGTWLVARKPHFLDLLFGPQECLGFSCAFAYGGLFLFGGLCDPDDPTDHHTPSNILRCPDSNDRSIADHLFHYTNSPTIPRASQFFVLQPLALVGTLV